MHRDDWVEKGQKLMGSNNKATDELEGVNLAKDEESAGSLGKNIVDSTSSEAMHAGDNLNSAAEKLNGTLSSTESSAKSSAQSAEDTVKSSAYDSMQVADEAVNNVM
ncbi:hypothetical protein AYI68_g5151 [Smittium mucronatum]|uniref:Uncharacterized protein n=1 Tax=Smittium mucronatum TaxID=133383 RepID=A0A1R0GV81_9FUNG|nr:hypothetical protein AYI68_g5151 [Smittium mucronatum]